MPHQNENHLPPIEINPENVAQHSIITLHGLGADGNDFVPIANELNLPKTLAVRYIFPHAPVMPISINNGYQMRAWYDIVSFSLDSHADHDGIQDSSELVKKLIENEEARGIASKNIILSGFSQGAAMALAVGLQHDKPLGGIIALSGYLPNANQVLTQINPVNRSTPVFMGHGIHDPIVPFDLGKKTAEALASAGLNVTFRKYNVPHSVCPAEIEDLRQWILGIW